MKRNLILLAALGLVAVGCETWESGRSESSEGIYDPAGAQSQSSDPNQASSSRNVGQSGNTNLNESGTSETLPQNNSPQ